jgi:transketolase
MRPAFIRTLLSLAEQDQRINLIVGDLGFGLLEPFAEKFPNRFLNIGVAEQNLAGVAAGMALSGKVVFTYSIANFPTLRAVEQIRNDICHHDANVKIVGVGTGLGYGALGVTHHATEDIAIMRALPRMTVVAPGDPVETELATRALAEYDGPAYFRLAKAGEPRVYETEPEFKLGKAIMVRDGSDVTLIATGSMLHTAVQAADRLAGSGIHARVLSMHTVKPLDSESVEAAARVTGAIVTLEEHSIIGGLGSAVAEVLAESDVHVRFKRVAIPSVFTSPVGSHDFLKKVHGLDLESVLNTTVSLLASRVSAIRASS